jgi:hypothetical protein
MLGRFGMQDCKPCNTPAAVHFKKDCLSEGESLSEEDTQRYQSIIAFVLSELSKYVSKHGKNHLLAAEKFVRYLQFSKDYHLEFSQEKLRKSFP